MKKITLFALAALTASSAFAATPQVKPQTSRILQDKLLMPAVQSVIKMQEGRFTSRAEDNAQIQEIESELPTYMTFDALYMGVSANLSGYSVPFGFVPSTGSVKFNPFYQAETYAWSWGEYIKGAKDEFTSEDVVLSVPVTPFKQFEGPSLKLSAQNIVLSYCDSVYAYFAGGNPAMYFEDDPNDPIGLSPVKYTNDLTRTYEAEINYTGAAGFSKETGTYDTFFDAIYSDYSYFDPVDSVYVTDYKDFKINAYGSVVPGSSAPYLLKGGYFVVAAQTTEISEVKIAAFGFDKDGEVNFADTLGVGSMILPKGQTAGSVIFTLSKTDDILGLETDEPITVPTSGLYLSFYGVNNPETITTFSPFYNISNKIDYYDRVDGSLNPIYNYTNPRHAFMEFTCISPEGEQISDYSPNFGLYGADPTALGRAFEYLIFYDVEYPFLANATQGFESGDLTIEIPVEGGQTNRFFEANQDIMQLIADEYVTLTVEGDDEWLAYKFEPEEDYPTIFDLLVAAEALPEDVEGRKATFTFTGYGFDNTITVKQGVVSSINEVVAAKAKNGKVFDLQGRAVKNATKGIYIVDGKKTILR